MFKVASGLSHFPFGNCPTQKGHWMVYPVAFGSNGFRPLFGFHHEGYLHVFPHKINVSLGTYRKCQLLIEFS